MIAMLPTINACLNTSAAVLLFCGWRAVKAGDINRHKKFMASALCVSALFLVSYLTYHHFTGTTPYTGTGLMRALYFFILLTHTPLAALIVPFAIAAVYHAVKGNFTAHVKITRWLWPAWMYVSVTGVLIYLFLYVFPK